MTTSSAYQSAQMRQAALSDLAKIGLLAFGTGAGFRGLKGLIGLGNRNIIGRARPLHSHSTVDIPIRRKDKKDEQEPLRKVAGWFEDILGAASEGAGQVAKPFGKAWRGENVSNPANIPWVMPLAILGGGGAMYGGYKLTDKIMDSRRRKEIEKRKEIARQEYERALSGHGKLGQALDVLYDKAVEKKAVDWVSPDTAGLGLGGALTFGGLLALASGLGAYNLSKKKRPDEILRAAKQRRARERMRRTPPPIYASPSYDGDELEDEALGKAAVDWSERLRKLKERRGDHPDTDYLS